MEQLRAALAGPHGVATIVTWAVAGVALAIALIHALRRGPRHRHWARWAAIGFPVAAACTLLASSVAGPMLGTALDVAMFVRMTGFWAMVVTAPFAVGQALGLTPPRWLARTHLALAAGFLLLLVTTDLAFTRNDTFDPASQFGPLAVAFLVPVAALAGWWLLTCLWQLRHRLDMTLFAIGGSATALALITASLVVEPVLADHLLVVGFLPVLAAATLVELRRTWTARRGARTHDVTAER